MDELAAPERHRDYFHRQLQVGRRVVCEWSVRERWPDWIAGHHALRGHDLVFDGFEFRTQEDADRFNLGAMTNTPGYDLESWEAAVEWVQEEPTPETRSVYEKLEESQATFEALRQMVENREL